MMILSGMAIALPMASVSSEIFKVRGRPDILPKMHALWTAFSVVLMLALLPGGAWGVASAWSLSTVVMATYAISRVPHVVPVSLREIALTILPSFFSAIVAGTFILIFNVYILHFYASEDLRTLVVLIADASMGFVIYVCGVALLDREALSEIRLTLAAMVRRRGVDRNDDIASTPESPD